MTTAICFDLDGTLLRYDRAYDAILADAFDEHLCEATDELGEAYERGFFEAFETFESRPYRAGMAAAVERAGRDSEDGEGGDAADVDAMVATLREREYAACTVPSATRDCLAELAADDGTPLAVVTDGVGEWQTAKLSRFDLSAYLDATVVSYDVGGHKTSGAPYAAARERLDADEYVMVGDDYEADVEAARAAGFVPVHYEGVEDGLFAILRAML